MNDTAFMSLAADRATPPPDPPSTRGIYWIALAATAIGFGVVIVLNMATPLENLRSQITAQMGLVPQPMARHLRGIIFLSLLLLSSCPPLLLFIHAFLRPLRRYLRQLDAADRPSEALLDQARRRLINLPFVMIPVNLGLWIVLPAVLYSAAHIVLELDARTAVVLAARAIMVGAISAGIMSLWIEASLRRRLIPFLFPEGRLAQVRGAARFAVSRRIRLYYRLGGLVPMVILLVTLLTLHWQLDAMPISARQYSAGILLFCLVLFVVFFVTLSQFNKLISNSIVEPVENILKAVREVRHGNLNTAAAVVSHDELGLLGDAVNEMIHGLRERQMVLETFGKYVTPEIRDEILSGRIPLDGEMKQVTVLFCDLRNFTPMVASAPPREVVRVINGYFEEMAQAIHAHGGLVLQYIGDEIEAVFGAPLALAQHAAAAAAAALEMCARLERYNDDLCARDWAPLSHGIGIHSGEAVAANIGSSQRLSYALVGDTVNLSSRLQGLSKELGRTIIISAATRSALPDRFRCEPLAAASVKGLTTPIAVFALTE
jgi:class 3 adenylate cyclase